MKQSNMKDIVVCLASQEDMQAVYTISCQALPQDGYTLQQYCRACDLPLSIFLVTKVDCQIVGFAYGSCIAGDLHLDLLAVSPDFLRQGVGYMLLNRFLKEGEDRGAQVVSLEVRSANWPAILLYQKAGMQIVGTRKQFYINPSDDALIMQKERG